MSCWGEEMQSKHFSISLWNSKQFFQIDVNVLDARVVVAVDVFAAAPASRFFDPRAFGGWARKVSLNARMLGTDEKDQPIDARRGCEHH